jgi:hypothetical protein
MNLSRRDALKLGTLSAAAAMLPSASAQQPSLAPTAFQPLPLGEIKPTGWLRNQLQVQADGMGGHLDEFWPDVSNNSGWLGGTGESWERGPYFLDGLYPLAILLDDPKLKAKANRWVEWTLTHQQANGMIGPASNDDWWPRMVMVKVLIQHYEATGDKRVIAVLTKYFHHQLAELPNRPLQSWGLYRWQDAAYGVQWLYDQTHDPELPRLAALLQKQGFDWTAEFRNFPFEQATDKTILGPQGFDSPLPERAMQAHGVNNGMALKTAAVQYRSNGNRQQEWNNFRMQLGKLDQFHGLPNGMFSCDEHLAGPNPVQGSELCTVVDTMFSLEVALSTFGDATIADRIEKIAYNALPGTFTDDMWAHQYDQQPNQVQCSLNSKPWSTNGPESNLYGLEPHFGCCTANFHQGWPKFAASLAMRTPDDGLAITLYAPCEINTKVRNTPVHITVETEYPFRDTARITIKSDKPIRFPLRLRGPQWAEGATVELAGKRTNLPQGGFQAFEREWKTSDIITIKLPMQPRVTRWFHNSIAIERGPLLFSLDPGQSWMKLRDRKPTADWQVFPTGPWNYALATDESTVTTLKVEEKPIGSRPFATATPAVTIAVPAHQVDRWRSTDGVANPLPESPLTGKDLASARPQETITLVPYAGAKLRISAFPQIKA